MSKFINWVKAYLAAHPYFNAAVVVVESSVMAAIYNYFAEGQAISFTMAGLKAFALAVGGAAIVGLRQWIKASPLQPQLPAAVTGVPEAAKSTAAGQ